ncbi:MAG: pyrroline-5-carboxylate reductase [bacterium]|jgi:pyrroline-5-carboxylate reductase
MNGKIGFLGAGMMAEALIKGLLREKIVESKDILVSDIIPERLEFLQEKYGVGIGGGNRQTAVAAGTVFLSVKPQVIEKVLLEISPVITPGKLVVSIAAGITTEYLESYLRKNARVVRLMPNTPCLVEEGITAFCLGQNAGEAEAEEVKRLIGPMGKILWTEEKMMDAVTGLSGSGPAFAFLLIEAMADGGVLAGFSRDTAVLLAAQTCLGAAKMVLEMDEHPGQLRDMVTSPGGTAIAGIQAMEESGVRAAMMKAIMAATKRSRELGMKNTPFQGDRPR